MRKYYMLLSDAHQIAEVSKGSKFAEEIKEEQEERKREEEVNFVTFHPIRKSRNMGMGVWRP